MRKRYAKDLLTDPALRARVLANIRGAAAPMLEPAIAKRALAPKPSMIAPSAIAVRKPPFWDRPWFAVVFIGIGFVAGAYLMQLS